MEKIRISRFLAQCGINSRRKCENLVINGKVKVNGEIIKELYYKVDPEKDIIEYNGNVLKIEEKIVLALNKPPGYLCTVKDNFNRKTVLNLIKNISFKNRLYPVGRLDYNSRGLLLMTNDGDFAYRILHPKFNIPKTYEIVLNKNLAIKDKDKLIKGVEIDGINVGIKEIILVNDNNNIINCSEGNRNLILTIHEGRKRIIRRLFKELGYKVMDLKRLKIGNFDVNEIKEGSYKILNNNDIKKILMLK
ncbi:MAG: rRNA pseudouridine synthase [Actinobacteria bacterium]|nr:rRNA pseudouridine synthase [Actinomycetota bacterium]